MLQRRKRIFLIHRRAKREVDWRSETNKIGKGSRNPRIRFLGLISGFSCHSLDQRISRPYLSSDSRLFRISPFIVRNQCNQVARSCFIGKVNSFQISNPLRLLSKCTFHFHSVDRVRVRRGTEASDVRKRIFQIRLFYSFFSNNFFTPQR